MEEIDTLEFNQNDQIKINLGQQLEIISLELWHIVTYKFNYNHKKSIRNTRTL